jgi:hypothetical protein
MAVVVIYLARPAGAPAARTDQAAPDAQGEGATS